MNATPQFSEKPCASSHATPGCLVRAPLWRKSFYWFITKVYFHRITLIHGERLPKAGPVLYLGLHRNGAVDGFVYDRALRAPVFMISTQLRKNWFARLFFDGIAVTRAKDEGDRGLNDAALGRCLDHLRVGGELFVFPEGTSSLGPRHLPFKSGASWLLLDYLERGGPALQVIPLGVHYECPWAFRSKVEVVVGDPISTELPIETGRLEKLKTLKRRVQTALGQVGVNVPSDDYQEMIQRFAYVGTLGTPRSYFKLLKAMERMVPEEILQRWKTIEPETQHSRLLLHQGVPLFPIGPLALYAFALLLTGAVTVAAVIINLPPFLAGWWAGRKFPDDRNVISLWKILVGIPVFFLWILAVAIILLFAGEIWWLAGYGVVTWLGLKCYYRFKKLLAAVHNGVRHPRLRSVMLAFHRTVIESLPE